MAHIRKDLKANYERDKIYLVPQALIVCPGFTAVTLFRCSSWFARRGIFGKAVSKIFWLLNIFFYSCHISPLARIGSGLKLPHPVGIVIGEGAQVGSNVTIYQNVTIGQSGPRMNYPSIENGVIIYAGAVLVGDISIGSDSVIGANSFVNSSCENESLMVGIPARMPVRNLGRSS